MRKRGKGEGTITQRKDERWEARITLSDSRRKSFYGKTRAEVAKRLAEAQTDLAKGLPVVAEKQTVGQYLLTWLDGAETRVAASTYRRYHALVHLHLIPEVGRIILARLTSQRIQTMYTDKLHDGMATMTVRLLHVVLHQALKEAVRLNLLQRNPASDARVPRAEHHEMQVLSEEQANVFLAHVAADRLSALYVLALTTGMRQGELLALRWKDIDWSHHELTVQGTIQIARGADGKVAYLLAEPKSAASRRKIALGELAIDALQAHRATQRKERELLLGSWKDEGRVFPNTLGGMITPCTLYQQFKARLKQVHLPSIRFHDLRHTAATILLSHGLPVKQVSEMLGHSDIAITLRVYGHVLPHMHAAAATTMDMVFRRA